MVYKFSLIVLLCFYLCGCLGNNQCHTFRNKSPEEIKIFLKNLDKNEQAHMIYIAGECKVIDAIPALIDFLEDNRITHHPLHKGMAINYISGQSLIKILNVTIILNSNDKKETLDDKFLLIKKESELYYLKYRKK